MHVAVLKVIMAREEKRKGISSKEKDKEKASLTSST